MCEQAELLKAEAIAARRAARAPWQNAHVDRIIREREARKTTREHQRVQKEAESAAQATRYCSKCRQRLPPSSFGKQSWCKPCAAAHARARYYRLKAGIDPSPRGPVSPETQREAAERVNQLTDLLIGIGPGPRISSQEGWDMATAELRSLWLRSGDKVCIKCEAVVLPSAMLPPGPANYYPGQCRSCARDTYEAHSLRVFGKSERRLIAMRDGTSVTLAEFARRHRERELGRPHQTTGADHHDGQRTLCALG